MKKSRDFQIFSISILDLLAGALGAVIILYVIVPKMKSDLPEIREKHGKETFEALHRIERKLKAAANAIENGNEQRAAQHILKAQEILAEVRKDVERLLNLIASLDTRIRQLKRKIRELEDKIVKLQEEMRKHRFFVVMIRWQQPADLDLWVRSPSGHEFSYQANSFTKTKGLVTADSKQGPGVEVFEIRNPDEGNYQIMLNLFGQPKESTDKIKYQARIFHSSGLLTKSGEVSEVNAANRLADMVSLFTVNVRSGVISVAK